MKKGTQAHNKRKSSNHQAKTERNEQTTTKQLKNKNKMTISAETIMFFVAQVLLTTDVLLTTICF